MRTSRLLGRGRYALASFAIVGGLVAGVACAPTKPPPPTESGPGAAFEYTGTFQSWTVPAGVTQATFDVYGAQGAMEAFNGGSGGRALATIPVTPGEVIRITVGGMGQNNSDNAAACVLQVADPDHGDGGFNGGGTGGLGCKSAGGGGASDVRIGGTAPANRVLVAGGGGGGSGNLFCPEAGSGGGVAGGSGQCDGAGSGGNQNGTSGSGQLGQGSVGADQGFLTGPGGGGGGGYYGGAGGQPGLAGGGGSGFGPAETTFENGVRQGNGHVTVAFGHAPTVTGLTPTSGAVGTPILISGTNFVPGQTSVTFGGVPAGDPVCVSSTQCTVTVPPGNTGTVGVQVTASGEQSLDTPASHFTYVPAPSITSISPPEGPEGTVVTVHGDGFVTTPGFTFVHFGGAPPVPATCTSSTQCTATAPAGVGELEVFVQTAAGSSNSVPFAVLPGVTSINPTSGPAAGGTVVTITGTGFSTTPGATGVSFGNASATAVGCATTTSCTAVSPSGTGTVHVHATVGGLQSAETPADNFTYS